MVSFFRDWFRGTDVRESVRVRAVFGTDGRLARGWVRCVSAPRSISWGPVNQARGNQAIVDGRAERSPTAGPRISPLGLVISTYLLRHPFDAQGQRRNVILGDRISKPWRWWPGSGSDPPSQ